VNAPTSGGSCDDHNACTGSDRCQAGTCKGDQVSCPGATQCRAAQTCDPATGSCKGTPFDDGTTCDDGNLCTDGDACQGGECMGAAHQCLIDGTSCDRLTGLCL
jgi:hypothetical protein